MLLAAKLVVKSCLVAVPCVWLFARDSISHMLCGCNADMRRFSARRCGSRKRKTLHYSWFTVVCLVLCVRKEVYVLVSLLACVSVWDYIS